MDQRHFAKTLRQNMTAAERLLWKHLRAHRLSGQKFRRQHPIGPYIVDFVHLGARLIVECDGGQHNESADDRRRDAWLDAQGFRVLRFWNHEILHQTESVLCTIFDVLNPLSPNPSPARGEGDRGVPTHGENTNDIRPPPTSHEGDCQRNSPLPSQQGDCQCNSPLPSRERGRGRGGNEQAKNRNHE